MDHPNIVRVYDLFEDEKYIYAVMEHMDGGSLYDLIPGKEVLNEVDAGEAIRALIDSLSYCHNLGVIHRDIKLQNLLLPSTNHKIGSIKISDFSLSKVLEEN